MLKKVEIISNDTNLPITVNADKVCRRYMRNGQMYAGYHSCTKCKNASWYDDDYCNNQHIHFIDKDNVKTTQVYCENYEVER